MKRKVEKKNVTVKEKKQKSKLKNKSKETEKCSRAMRAWLSTSTCEQSKNIRRENPRDGAVSQTHKMAIQSDETLQS